MTDCGPLMTELHELVDALTVSSLSHEQWHRLNELLKLGPEYRWLYLTVMGVHHNLMWQGSAAKLPCPEIATLDDQQEVGGTDVLLDDALDAILSHVSSPPSAQRPTELLCAERDGTVSESAETSVPRVEPRLGSAVGMLFPGRHPLRFLLLSTSLTLAFCAALILLIWSTMMGDRSEVAGDAPVPAVSSVAKVTGMADCIFSANSWQPHVGDSLPKQQEICLESGLIEIKYHCGTRVLLEGPVHFTAAGDSESQLQQGRLTALVPPRAVGFCVKTPYSTVTDLGTEFGLAVDADGQVDVHVFEGMVSVELNPAVGGQGGRPEQRIVMASETVRIDPGSGILQVAPKSIARPFILAMPEKVKQGVTHRLALKNPSFERPNIRRHPKFDSVYGQLDIPVIGWRTSDFPGERVFNDAGCQGQYVVSDIGVFPNIPPATDGNQIMWLSLDKHHPDFHEGWVYQSLGVVDQKDVGRRLRLTADVSAMSYYLKDREGPRDGAAVSVAFATGVAAMQSGQVVGTPGTWPEMLVEHGWKTLTATLTVKPEMIGQELFVRLMASDPDPKTYRDPYQWDNVRCVVEPSTGSALKTE